MSTPTHSMRLAQTKMFINRNFALIWLGQIVSQFGDYIFTTTLTIWIASTLGRNQAWAPLAVGAIVLTATAPAVLIRPLAGVFVDRWDKRRTMLVMDAVRSLLLILLVLIIVATAHFLAGNASLSLLIDLCSVYGVVLLASVCAQFFNPARFALTGVVVEKADRTRAFSRTESTRYLAFIVGPGLGALLIATAGIQAALIINALSFVVSFLTIFAVQRGIASPAQGAEKSQRKSAVWLELRAGIGFLVHNRVLMAITVAFFLAMLGSGSQDTLVIFFLTQNVHVNADLYGLLSSVFAAGAVLGALLATPLSKYLGITRSLWGALICYGVLSVIFARLTSFLPALLVFFLLGLNTTIFTVVSSPLVLQVTPQAMVGRVNSAFSSLVQFAWMLSTLIAGYLASSVRLSLFGPGSNTIDAILTMAGVLTVIGGVYAMVRLGTAPPREAEQQTADSSTAQQTEVQTLPAPTIQEAAAPSEPQEEKL